MVSKSNLALLALLTALNTRVPAADTTAPTCELVNSAISLSSNIPGGYRFTFHMDATDSVMLQSYTGTKGPLEYRARVNGGAFGNWSPWPLDYSQPIYFDVKCFEFTYEVRSVDQAGNRSIIVNKVFRAPFVIQKDVAKASFGTAHHATGGITALGLIAGDDFDADGHRDFAQADHDSGVVNVRRNTKGKGESFITKPLPFLANSVDDLASGRISNPVATGANDSLPDLVVASNATLFVKTNQGANPVLKFTSRVPTLSVAQHYLQYVAVADLNSGGFADIVATAAPMAGAGNTFHKVAVFLNKGKSGGFKEPVLYNYGNFARDLVLRDLNGDSSPDIAVIDSSSVNVLINNNAGTFGSVTSNFTNYTPHRLAVADLNGDGKADMVVATQALFALGGGLTRHALYIEILCGQGGGLFTRTYTQAIASEDLSSVQNYNCSVALGDLNRDGNLDIVTGTSLSSTIHIRHLQALSNSTGKLLTFLDRGESTTQSGGKIRALALADLNGDGKADIISNNASSTKQTSILINTTP